MSNFKDAESGSTKKVIPPTGDQTAKIHRHHIPKRADL